MEPLKTDSSISSGLERSHSSPNLMQVSYIFIIYINLDSYKSIRGG